MIKRLDFNSSANLWAKVYKAQKLRGPFFQHGWHKVWYDTLGKDYDPLLLIFDGKVIISLALNNKSVIFSGGDETTDYNDAVGNEELKSSAWKECFNYLKNKGVKNIDLKNIPEGKTTQFFQSKKIHLEREDTTPLFELPESWDDYLLSLKRKWRKELKRKVNNFERDNVNVTLEKEGSIDCLISLMKKNSDKIEFFKRKGYEDYFRKIYKEFEEEAKIECVSVDGELAASIYYFVTENSFLLYNSGFDKEKFDSAGFYIKAMNVKKAINSEVTTYNFLQGDERYKYELGGKDRFVYRVRVNL